MLQSDSGPLTTEQGTWILLIITLCPDIINKWPLTALFSFVSSVPYFYLLICSVTHALQDTLASTFQAYNLWICQQEPESKEFCDCMESLCGNETCKMVPDKQWTPEGLATPMRYEGLMCQYCIPTEYKREVYTHKTSLGRMSWGLHSPERHENTHVSQRKGVGYREWYRSLYRTTLLLWPHFWTQITSSGI